MGGRSEVEKEIRMLQKAEKAGRLDKLNCECRTFLILTEFTPVKSSPIKEYTIRKSATMGYGIAWKTTSSDQKLSLQRTSGKSGT